MKKCLEAEDTFCNLFLNVYLQTCSAQNSRSQKKQKKCSKSFTFREKSSTFARNHEYTAIFVIRLL